MSQLMWYQDSFLLDPTDRRSMDSRGDRHMLTIRNIQSSDFGNYRFVFISLFNSDEIQAMISRNKINLKSIKSMIMKLFIFIKIHNNAEHSAKLIWHSIILMDAFVLNNSQLCCRQCIRQSKKIYRSIRTSWSSAVSLTSLQSFKRYL